MVHDALSVSVCTTPLRLFANRFRDNMELHLYETQELHAKFYLLKGHACRDLFSEEIPVF